MGLRLRSAEKNVLYLTKSEKTLSFPKDSETPGTTPAPVLSTPSNTKTQPRCVGAAKLHEAAKESPEPTSNTQMHYLLIQYT